jgi:primosomal protein N' (replication factor Y)
MLPPEIELRHDREYWLTDSGRAYFEELAAGAENADVESSELEFLRRFVGTGEKISAIQSAAVRRLPGGEAAAERFVRRGYLAARDMVHRRKTRSQKIVAWNPAKEEPAANAAEEKIREVLTATRGPLPLALLTKKAQVSRAVIHRLEKQGRVLTWEEPLSVEEDSWDTDFAPPTNILNAEQKLVLAEIWRWLVPGKFAAGLLHGVTGSGKTEVYLGAIEATISRGKTAIVLVPEIALTLWVGRLVRARFGETVAVLHSGLPDVERARDWWRVRHGQASIVVGTRSAVFAPLETSYKQE